MNTEPWRSNSLKFSTRITRGRGIWSQEKKGLDRPAQRAPRGRELQGEKQLPTWHPRLQSLQMLLVTKIPSILKREAYWARNATSTFPPHLETVPSKTRFVDFQHILRYPFTFSLYFNYALHTTLLTITSSNTKTALLFVNTLFAHYSSATPTLTELSTYYAATSISSAAASSDAKSLTYGSTSLPSRTLKG
mmetsp:Transcript_48673/g.126316  ORF Transcript_48673/g.126316 Transcript_48673/m.126316 type:complete len:192 (-) Transcript_48673:736-1311(-)